MKRPILQLFCVFLALFALSARAQDTLTDPADSLAIYDIPLEDLTSVKAHRKASELEKLVNSLVSVASRKPLSTRETPGIVSLVTSEEIKSSGARDLMDVLRLIPGIDFGVDVQGVVGIGMRGNWAHEGKVLMLIDGQEMNEIMFSSLQFGNHYPVDQIERVEVIRGPGSAIYGGFAEYGVINIITKSATLKGFELQGIYGQLQNNYARKNAGFSAGTRGKKWGLGISTLIGQGHRSDRDFTDFNGNTFNLTSNRQDPFFTSIGLNYQELSFRFIADKYRATTMDGFSENLPEPYQNDFLNYAAEVKYNWILSEKFTVTPRLNFVNQLPWLYEGDVDSLITPYKRNASRYKANISSSWKPGRRFTLLTGTEFYHDVATDLLEDSYFYTGEKTVRYYNYAAFGEAIFRTYLVNFIAGARFDQHTIYGNAFNPRLALTKTFDKFHFKALYSHAFRAPGIENINLSIEGNIRPERTRVTELEAGYKIGRKMLVTANLFDINTYDVIVYSAESDEEEAYVNFPRTGTRGAEIELKHKEKWGSASVNYSFYSAKGKEKIPAYEVPVDDRVLLAFPGHKVNFSGNVKVGKYINLSPSALWRSSVYAYGSIDSTGAAQVDEFKPQLNINFFAGITDLPFKGISIGAGVYDILDRGVLFFQPYNSYHAPLPGPGREIILKLSYRFSKEEVK